MLGVSNGLFMTLSCPCHAGKALAMAETLVCLSVAPSRRMVVVRFQMDGWVGGEMR